MKKEVANLASKEEDNLQELFTMKQMRIKTLQPQQGYVNKSNTQHKKVVDDLIDGHKKNSKHIEELQRKLH
eukprot:157200-Ditylum_brightwellii.AAC.1